VDVFEFFEKLGKHCAMIVDLGPDSNCHLCKFRKFCYTIPQDVSPSFLQETLDNLEASHKETDL